MRDAADSDADAIAAGRARSDGGGPADDQRARPRVDRLCASIDTGRARDPAVSPVVGVLLIVAITAILAAVVATFALGTTDELDATSPQVSLTSTYDEDAMTLTITHDSGAVVPADRLSIVGPGGTADWADRSPTTAPGESVAASDYVELSGVGPDDTVRIYWTDPDDGASTTLFVWRGPR